jgi:serine phosphatase RsbU (regulator of sigma subunit)
MSLATIMTWTAVASILSASLVAGYYALTVLYQNKLADTWAIMFLELEHSGTVLAERLGSSAKAMDLGQDVGDSLFKVDAAGSLSGIRGSLPETLTGTDFNLDPGAALDWEPLTVLGFGGETYLARLSGGSGAGKERLLGLRKINPATFVVRPERPADQGALYVLTREGRLLYSSDPRITETNVVGRTLVQRFIAAPIKQGQLELADKGGPPFYGFFFEVPDTNLILFSEVTRASALAPIRQVVLRFLAVLSMILFGAAVLLQFPLARITGPMAELAHVALSVGQGRFDVILKSRGVGELATLTKAFAAMAAGLVERDQRVAVLMQEQAVKARLEGELAIARRIQENLLPRLPLPPEAGLVVAAEYISASECAGDWYHYVYDEQRRETLVVIADVSGHGAGSSMFTAMIAGLFDEFRSRDERFDLVGFARSANNVIYRLGRQQWHATMMIARIVTGQEAIDVLLAGHPPPLIKSPEGGRSPILRGSSVLGDNVHYTPLVHTVPFPRGSSLLVYTDGLTEAANDAGKAFGRKRVRQGFLGGSGDPHEALRRLLDDWRSYRGEQPARDDVCVLAMRTA